MTEETATMRPNVAVRLLTALLLVAGLAACESSRPATRTGVALDRAGTATGNAVGEAAQDTGAALNRAGNWVRNRSN
jgi:hypothetical protein